MNNEKTFSGNICFLLSANRKKIAIKYNVELPTNTFEQSMMSSFSKIDFTTQEKQKLSRGHRKYLSSYLNLDLFQLNVFARELVNEINLNSESQVKIFASDYGAFICLAAICSGKINRDKKIELELHDSPIGIFPSSLLKKPINKNLKIKYQVSEKTWINEFETLQENKITGMSFLRVA